MPTWSGIRKKLETEYLALMKEIIESQPDTIQEFFAIRIKAEGMM